MRDECPICHTRPVSVRAHVVTDSHRKKLYRDYLERKGDEMYRELAEKVIAAGRAKMFARDKTEFGAVVRSMTPPPDYGDGAGGESNPS